MSEQLLHRTVVTLNGQAVGYLTGFSGTAKTFDIIEAPPTCDADFDTPAEKLQGPCHAGTCQLTVQHDDAQRVILEASRDGAQPVKMSRTYPSGATSSEVDVFIKSISEPSASGATSFLTTTIEIEYVGIPSHAVAGA